MILTTKGNRERKTEFRQTFAVELDQDVNYQSPFWRAVHVKAKEMCAEECVKSRVIDLLISIARDLLKEYKKEQIPQKDLHFLTECFNVAMPIYGADLFDILDGQLYAVTELFDFDDRVEYMETELTKLEHAWTKLKHA